MEDLAEMVDSDLMAPMDLMALMDPRDPMALLAHLAHPDPWDLVSDKAFKFPLSSHVDPWNRITAW